MLCNTLQCLLYMLEVKFALGTEECTAKSGQNLTHVWQPLYNNLVVRPHLTGLVHDALWMFDLPIRCAGFRTCKEDELI